MLCILVVAKTGFVSLNVQRKRFSRGVQFIAVLSICICLFCMIYGVSTDYTMIQQLPWAHGSVLAFDHVLAAFIGFEDIGFNLGVLTYTVDGARPTETHSDCFAQATLEVFEQDTSCLSVTQNYTLKPNQYLTPGECSTFKFLRADAWLAVYLKPDKTTSTVTLYSDQQCSSSGLCTCTATGAIYNQQLTMNSCHQASITLSGTQYDFSYKVRPKWKVDPLWLSGLYASGATQMVLMNGEPYNDGHGCKSITCTSPLSSNSAELRTYDQSCLQVTSSQTVSVPLDTSNYASVFGGGTVARFMCHDSTGSGHSCELPTGISSKCTHSYSECTGGAVAAEEPWKEGGTGCDNHLAKEMCEYCYSAGVNTYVLMVSTVAIQLPLTWLSLARTKAQSDSRCKKFLILPFSAIVILGSVLSHTFWRADCFTMLTEQLDQIAVRYHLDTLATVSTDVHWSSSVPVWLALLTVCVFVLNMLTPVPELYPDQWRDPENIPIKSNSGGNCHADEAESGSRMGQVILNLASSTHNQWNAEFHVHNDTEDAAAERIKEVHGQKFNIAVPWEHLHPLWQSKQVAAQREYLQQLKPMVDEIEHVLSLAYEDLVTSVAVKCHILWMKNESWRKDAGQDLELFVPFSELDEVEQEKDKSIARLLIPVLWNMDLATESLLYSSTSN